VLGVLFLVVSFGTAIKLHWRRTLVLHHFIEQRVSQSTQRFSQSTQRALRSLRFFVFFAILFILFVARNHFIGIPMGNFSMEILGNKVVVL
jgi:hypothetical protein